MARARSVAGWFFKTAAVCSDRFSCNDRSSKNFHNPPSSSPPSSQPPCTPPFIVLLTSQSKEQAALRSSAPFVRTLNSTQEISPPPSRSKTLNESNGVRYEVVGTTSCIMSATSSSETPIMPVPLKSQALKSCRALPSMITKLSSSNASLKPVELVHRYDIRVKGGVRYCASDTTCSAPKSTPASFWPRV